jgi:hypothetical protein
MKLTNLQQTPIAYLEYKANAVRKKIDLVKARGIAWDIKKLLNELNNEVKVYEKAIAILKPHKRELGG